MIASATYPHTALAREDTSDTQNEPERGEASRRSCFPIRTINLRGVVLLPEALLRASLEKNVGRCMDARDIHRLIAELNSIYKEFGLPEALVILPDQTIADGILDIVVVENPPSSRRISRMPKKVKKVQRVRSVPPRPTPPSCWRVRRIRVVGSPLIRKLGIQKTVAPYEGRCLKPADIARLTSAIDSQFATHGYITTRSGIPSQNIADGTLVIKITEGRLEDVTYVEIRNGKRIKGPRSMLLSALSLRKGDIIHIGALEQALAQMNRAPSSNANVNIKPGKMPGGSILEFTNEIRDPYRVYAGLILGKQEDLSSLSGELTLEADNLFNINDTAILTLSSGNNGNTLSASYSFPYRHLDFSISTEISETLSQISEVADYYKQDGSVTAAIGWRLLRDRKMSARLQASFSHKWVRRYINSSKLRPQRLSVFRLAATFDMYPQKNIALSITPGISFGLPILGATSDVNDPTAPKSKFSALLLNTSLVSNLAQRVQFLSTLQMQYAFQPLYASEQITLGGASSVRGFESVSLKGDSGIVMRNEIGFTVPRSFFSPGKRTHVEREIQELTAGLRPYLFLDTGLAHDRAQKETYSMIGAGAGIRLDWKRLSLDVSVARALYRSSKVEKPAAFDMRAYLRFKVY